MSNLAHKGVHMNNIKLFIPVILAFTFNTSFSSIDEPTVNIVREMESNSVSFENLDPLFLTGDVSYVSSKLLSQKVRWDVTDYNLYATVQGEEDLKGESFKNPLNVPLLNQMDAPRLYNGCEVTSLAMVLNYHNVDVKKNELANQIDRVPLTYSNGLKGNPNEGFVGDMENGPGLSVYHGPIYELAKSYVGERAVDLTGSDPETLYEYVKVGKPIWVITTGNFAPANDFKTWNTPHGEVDVSYSVHSVVITGYSEEYVYINNPYGEKNQKVDRHLFEQAFKQMGSQAIVIK
ncbi:C39 family peptidase [Pontibacillus salipaludis]|uniref:Peptidase C39-like domain-containing protein n=1 Tax=Pontibacillus salipaludis TaxID=1697394 RepID=A0ABQ1PIG5_9BACI|nr:C39 family peptidase [Pontibacillus salipaludis]GGC97651.1 hypothetical protein GCM10011389_00990 [Pontibacillus salipaludis]